MDNKDFYGRFSEEHGLVVLSEKELSVEILRELEFLWYPEKFQSQDDPVEYFPMLTYCDALMGASVVNVYEETILDLAKSKNISATIIDSKSPQLPLSIDPNSLYLVVLDRNESEKESSWVARVRFAGELAKTSAKGILLWDGFPSPNHPDGLQFNFERLLKDKVFGFDYKENTYEISLGQNILLALSGYLVENVTHDPNSLGQIARSYTKPFALR